MSAALEDSVAKSIAEVMSGGTHEEVEVSHYKFDVDFQRKIVDLVLNDEAFNRSTEGLVNPGYFENMAHAILVDLGLKFFAKYKTTPSLPALIRLVKGAREKKIIRDDSFPEVMSFIDRYKKSKGNFSDKEFVVDEVATFARHQAMANATLDLINLLEKGEFDKAAEIIKKANEVGKTSDITSYDYYDEIDSRTNRRKETLAGLIPKTGISTGYPKLDNILYHGGWGRKEMVVFMGGPKSGKSTALGDFAKNASLAGYNALYVTLEVSSDIISDRIDASLADMIVSEVAKNPIEVANKIQSHSLKAGRLVIEERPSGTMTPNELGRIINKHKSNGLIFDLIAVDYADIMAPNIRMNDVQENSKSIYVDLRGIAASENVALLTATQTNREGAKSSIARMEHVAEDFNKVRIADLMISINKTDDEKKNGLARLFLAASRNQKGDLTIHIKQDQERMKFITEITDIS